MTDNAIQYHSALQFLMEPICNLALSNRADDWKAEELRAQSNADSVLVKAALNGDGDAYGAIVDLYQVTIATQMRRFSRDPSLIEELTHDVFVEGYMSLSTYRADSPLIHWLRKVAVRVGYRHWKTMSRKSEQSVPLSPIETLEQLVDGTDPGKLDASETLGSLLDLLPVRDRLVLTLIYWDGCSTAEAAELAGWSHTMVKVQAFRARQKLRKLIEESLQ